MAQTSANIPKIVPVIDQVNGTVLINWLQESIRPINELTTMTRNLVDPNADYEVVYDASTNTHVRVLATRASQVNYLADWVGDTRTGSLWTIASSIYAVRDHIHPITKISPLATAPTITFSWFTTPAPATPLAMTYVRSTDETITYVRQWSATIPNVAWRRTCVISNVAWYNTPSIEVKNIYRLSAMAWYPWANTMEAGQSCPNRAWSSTTYFYNASIAPWVVVNISNLRIEATYTLN